MLIVNSHQTCVNCKQTFTVTYECYNSKLTQCPQCLANYIVRKRNESKYYNYAEIELSWRKK